jgi:hypothetical protein
MFKNQDKQAIIPPKIMKASTITVRLGSLF